MEITEYRNYQQYKAELDEELTKTAEGFVRIGYLLKVARDTNILQDSGYKSMAEFAQAEYGLSKDIVSRYVAINDKYSEGGYSDRLAAQYQNYGYSKLAEMLTLPDAVSEVLHPELTKEEIRTIKTEIKEEEKITDLEVMMEETQIPGSGGIMQQALLKYLEEDTEAFKALCEFPYAGLSEEKLKQIAELLAPSEIAIHVVRVPGVGRLIVSIRGRDKDIEVVNSRSGAKETTSWEELYHILESIFGKLISENSADRYKEIYGHDMPEPEEQEVAPAQPHWPAKEIPDKKKKSKVTVPKETTKKKKSETAKPPERRTEEPKNIDSTSCDSDTDKQPEQITEDIQEEIKTEHIEEEQLPEGQDKAEGTDEKPEASSDSDEEAAYDIPTESQTEIMSDDKLVDLWEGIEEAGDKVIAFIDDTSSYNIVAGHISAETIKKAYHDAVSLAAGLEKLMIEVKKRGINQNDKSQEAL